jgi:hypothetical protein
MTDQEINVRPYATALSHRTMAIIIMTLIMASLERLVDDEAEAVHGHPLILIYSY